MSEPNGNNKMVSVSNPADPTVNVRALIDESVQRIDDLSKSGFKNIHDKLEGEIRRIDEKIKLQAEAGALLNFAESKRLDAIRSVDINAVAVASERATQQASVLANQVVTSAETLRTLVASTATTVAQQLAVISNQLSDRISALERSQYEGIGKGRVADPMMTELALEVKALREARSTTSGFGSGMEKMWGWIIAAAVAAFAIYSQLNK